MDWFIVLGIIVVIVVTVMVAAKLSPRGSGGAPGEVVGHEPLSEPTGAGWDPGHTGGADDRPGAPGQEPMNPEELPSRGSAQHDER
ncbi:hypothetical protein BH23ACT9_BH23ACT9_31010 [soil metagenome]